MTTTAGDVADDQVSSGIESRLSTTIGRLFPTGEDDEVEADPDADVLVFEDDQPDAFVFERVKRRKVVGRKTVERRYSEKVVTRPVYETETYIKRVPVKDENGYVVGYKDVQAQRRVRQIGEKKVKRVVPDPEGDIVREISVAQYGPGGPDELPGEWLGNNAMALYGLCLALPHDDTLTERRDRLAEQLARHLREYGLPDRTRELAWAVIALAETDAELYGDLIDHAVEKLLLGQHRDGKLAGLWGEVSVDRDRFRHAFELNTKLLEVIEKAGGFEAAREDRRGSEALLVQLGIQRKVMQRVAREVHWNPQDPTRTNIKIFNLVADHGEEGQLHSIVPGLPYNPLTDSFGDLTSTGLALRALLAAHRVDRLPNVVQPLELVEKRPLRQKVWSTRQAVDAAVKAIADRRSRRGTWEAGLWSSDRPEGSEDDHEPVLFDQVVALATFAIAGQLPGADRTVKRYQRVIEAAREQVEPQLVALNDWRWIEHDKPRFRFTFTPTAMLGEDRSVGGRVPPVDALLWAVWAGLPVESDVLGSVYERSLLDDAARRANPNHPLTIRRLLMLPRAFDVDHRDHEALDEHFRGRWVSVWTTDQRLLVELHWLLIDALSLESE